MISKCVLRYSGHPGSEAVGAIRHRHSSGRTQTCSWVVAAVLTTMFAGLPLPATAATFIWDGDGPDESWSSQVGNFNTNWTFPSLPRDGDSLVFAGTRRLSSVNDLLSRVADLLFYPGDGSFTLDGRALDVTGTIDNLSATPQTINLPIWFAGDNETWTARSAALSLGGGLSFRTGAGRLTLDGFVDVVTGGGFSLTEQNALTLQGGSSLRSAGGGIGDSSPQAGAAAMTVQGSGSRWQSNDLITIGSSGEGALDIVDGGAVSAVQVCIACAVDSAGLVTVTGPGAVLSVPGGVSSGNLLVGYEGKGSLALFNGGSAEDQVASIGTSAGSTGRATVEGAGSEWRGGSMSIGENGDGILIVSNGGRVVRSQFLVGHWNGSTGQAAVVGAGAEIISSGLTRVGVNGSGELNIRDGGTVRSVTSSVGTVDDSAGLVNVDGAGSSWLTSGELVVGFQGQSSGVINVSNGALVSSGTGRIGWWPEASGIVDVTGNGSRWEVSGILQAGVDGTASLHIADGGQVVADVFNIGSRGDVHLDGGTLSFRSMSIAEGGDFVWSSGSLHFRESATLGGSAPLQARALTLYVGQALLVDDVLSVGSQSVLVLAGGTLKADQVALQGGTVVAADGLNLTVAGSLQGYGTVVGTIGGGVLRRIVAEGGTLVLGDANASGGFTFDGIMETGSNQVILLSADRARLGGTTLLGAGSRLSAPNGMLLVGGHALAYDGDASVHGAFTNQGQVVGYGGTLTFLDDVNGDGDFAGDVIFEAGYAPGNSTASVSFNGSDVVFDPDSLLTMEIVGDRAGTQFDQLTDIGLLTFNGLLRLEFGAEYVPVAGARFRLFEFQTFSGVLDRDRIQVVGLDPGRLDFSQLATTGTLVVAVVPEPATYVTLLVGLALLMSRRRRATPVEGSGV